MTNFGLTNAVNAAKALLQPVGIPGQIVVDHQVGALQVDAFASSVGGDENLHLWIMAKGFLHLHTLFTA